MGPHVSCLPQNSGRRLRSGSKEFRNSLVAQLQSKCLRYSQFIQSFHKNLFCILRYLMSLLWLFKIGVVTVKTKDLQSAPSTIRLWNYLLILPVLSAAERNWKKENFPASSPISRKYCREPILFMEYMILIWYIYKILIHGNITVNCRL